MSLSYPRSIFPPSRVLSLESLSMPTAENASPKQHRHPVSGGDCSRTTDSTARGLFFKLHLAGGHDLLAVLFRDFAGHAAFLRLGANLLVVLLRRIIIQVINDVLAVFRDLDHGVTFLF